MNIRRPKTVRQIKIPYRLYGKIARAFRQAPMEPEGKVGEEPLPGVPPASVQIL